MVYVGTVNVLCNQIIGEGRRSIQQCSICGGEKVYVGRGDDLYPI